MGGCLLFQQKIQLKTGRYKENIAVRRCQNKILDCQKLPVFINSITPRGKAQLQEFPWMNTHPKI
jgi:hypothetical protein